MEELSGNVWEWTRSLWGTEWGKPEFRYPYQPTDGREDPKAAEGVPRVVRGGAFYNSERLVRAAYRDRYNPDGRSNFQGFRVVVSPFSSSNLKLTVDPTTSSG